MLLTAVGFRGLGGDRCGRVTMLHVTGCGRHYAAGCARREAEGYRQTGQQGRHGSRYNFVNLLFGHVS